MTNIAFLDLIRKNCNPYLETLRITDQKILVRGSHSNIETYKEYNHNLNERRPLNMPIDIHDKLNHHFEPEFGWKIRNGVFCFGIDINKNISHNLGYGNNYYFFPKGEFEFVYAPKIFDLFEYFNEPNTDKNDKFVNIQYKSNDFAQAVLTTIDPDFSNEISLKVNEYYLVNMKYKEQIKKIIWTK